MSILKVHLWREWREHRAALFGVFGLMPVVVGIATALLPTQLLRTPDYQVFFPMLVVIAMLLAVGGELLATGRIHDRTDRTRWLERLPGGLAEAFRAKRFFFIATTTAALVYGIVATRILTGTVLGGILGFDAHGWLLVAGYAGLVLWTFPVSAWAPRGVLALPLAAVLVALLFSPLMYLVDRGYLFSATEMIAFASIHVALASLAARFAFVGGHRLGRGPGQACWRGLVIAAPCLVAPWGWAGLEVYQGSRIDPSSEGFSFSCRYVSDDGSTAFVTVSQEWPDWEEAREHILQVDLATGDWTRIGGDGDGLGAVFKTEEERGIATAREGFLVESEDGVTRYVFLAATGEPVEPDEGMPFEALPLIFRGDAQWLVNLETYELMGIYDPFRDEVFDWDGLDLYADDTIHVCSGRWVVQSFDFESEGTGITYEYFDPTTNVREPVDWPEDAALVTANGLEGRVLLQSVSASGQVSLHLCDPTDGTLESIAASEDVYLSRSAFPEDELLSHRESAFFSGCEIIYRLDLEAMELVLVGEDLGGFVRWEGEDRVVVATWEALVVVNLSTGRRRVAFPPLILEQ